MVKEETFSCPVAPPLYVKFERRHETTCLINLLHNDSLSLQQQETKRQSSTIRDTLALVDFVLF